MGEEKAVQLVISDDQLDPELTDLTTRRLAAEVRQLAPVTSVSLICEPAPSGAKGGEIATTGALLLSIAAGKGVLTALITTASNWLSLNAQRHRLTVEIEGNTIELESADTDERRLLIEAFVRAHEPEEGSGT